MKKLCLILTGLLAIVPVGWCAYADKEDTNTNYIAEPVLPQGTPAAQKAGATTPATAATIPSTETCRRKCCPTATSNRTTVTG